VVLEVNARRSELITAFSLGIVAACVVLLMVVR